MQHLHQTNIPHKATSNQYNTPNVNKINDYPITTLLTKLTQSAQSSK